MDNYSIIFENWYDSKNNYEKCLYDKQLEEFQDAWIKDISCIQDTIDSVIKNLKDDKTRFIIYWEPQSWKTNMMIALTTKLLDLWYKKIVILINDNLQLLKQNLDRFQSSKIRPIPKNFDDYSSNSETLSNDFVIFSKKNAKKFERCIFFG